MNEFDDRWRRLAAVARSAPDGPPREAPLDRVSGWLNARRPEPAVSWVAGLGMLACAASLYVVSRALVLTWPDGPAMPGMTMAALRLPPLPLPPSLPPPPWPDEAACMTTGSTEERR
jgi:hypothetical protein